MPTQTEQQDTNGNRLLVYMGLVASVALFAMVVTQNVLLTHSAQQAQVVAAIEPDPFENVALEGRAAFVLDVLTGDMLYEKNASAQLPLASLTKMMVALIANEQLDQDDIVHITPRSLAPEGDSGFLPGDSWLMQDLRDFSLMTSSNDGATALAYAIEEKTSVPTGEFMTARARTLGLTQTYFLNPTGLDEHEKLFSGAYGSARDMGILLAYITSHEPSALEATTAPDRTFTNMQGTEFIAENTNTITGYIPGLSASKTGLTDLAGGNLAVAFEPEPGHTYVAVVLGSSLEGRFDDIVQLVRATLE